VRGITSLVEPVRDEWEVAETRLSERAAVRADARARRDRRRRWAPWLLGLLVLPAVGAGALIWLLESGGGDLRRWSAGAALAGVAAALLVPAAVSALVGRRCGFRWWEALLLGAVTAALAGALVAGVGLVALDLGAR
jgi:hypothetical protein